MEKLEHLRDGLSKQTMKQQIAAHIAHMVQFGLLMVGEELPSARHLAELFGVSRETARGAVKMLCDSGMLETAQGSRTRVLRVVQSVDLAPPPPIDPKKYPVRDLFEARFLLETRAARLAATTLSDAAKLRLKELVAMQAELGMEPMSFMISDAEFHRTIYMSCGNGFISELLDLIHADSVRSSHRITFSAHEYERSTNDHRQILDALERGDGEAAALAMEHHFQWIRQAHYSKLENF